MNDVQFNQQYKTRVISMLPATTNTFIQKNVLACLHAYTAYQLSKIFEFLMVDTQNITPKQAREFITVTLFIYDTKLSKTNTPNWNGIRSAR